MRCTYSSSSALRLARCASRPAPTACPGAGSARRRARTSCRAARRARELGCRATAVGFSRRRVMPCRPTNTARHAASLRSKLPARVGRAGRRQAHAPARRARASCASRAPTRRRCARSARSCGSARTQAGEVVELRRPRSRCRGCLRGGRRRRRPRCRGRARAPRRARARTAAPRRSTPHSADRIGQKWLRGWRVVLLRRSDAAPGKLPSTTQPRVRARSPAPGPQQRASAACGHRRVSSRPARRGSAARALAPVMRGRLVERPAAQLGQRLRDARQLAPARCASRRPARAARRCGTASAAGCRAHRSRARARASGSVGGQAADLQRAVEGHRAAEAEPEAERRRTRRACCSLPLNAWAMPPAPRCGAGA